MAKTINNQFEARFASVCLAATLLIFTGLFHYLAKTAWHAHVSGHTRLFIETLMFAGAMFFIAYGNVLYQVCLVGYYRRRMAHNETARATLEEQYLRPAPSLSIIIPSYKEERKVNWQTMISAALAEYPSKNVVLLIDDPYYAKALPDRVRLEDTRLIAKELQAMFDAPAAHYRAQQDAFKERIAGGSIDWQAELTHLSGYYEEVAQWLNKVAADFMGNETRESLHYADRFFVETILDTPARQHKEQAESMRALIASGDAVSQHVIERHYARLVGLFTIQFSNFERKKYTNLSQESNKAMNLNSYMGLIGKSWKEVKQNDGTYHLYEVEKEEADFSIPAVDYVNTIDSDSLMVSDYALRLIEIMEQSGNQKLAVIQSPCSSFQGCPKGLERTAGACIDIQFLTHQGYTYWGASFWVGANAMLRRKALEEIKEMRIENGHPVAIYIQDRTVIEDTESTIDLVHKGWRLYNYPERMTFSATPPDYGSLLIQRRRWSNGGLLILPKLFNYVVRAPKNLSLAKELFMRFHYLASTTSGCFAALMLLLYPFGSIYSSMWLPLSVVPFLFLHIRDLKNSGYKATDSLRICAMNLMLLPIVTGGVLKSFQQILTGKKIPFGRTPKITGRTAAPALYSLIAVLMPITFASVAVRYAMMHHWAQFSFTMLNTGFLTYALVYYVGVKAAMEDMLAGVKMRWRKAFYNAEIIQIPAAQPTANTQLAVGQ